MVKDKAATIKGVFLTPGVSKNRRIYDNENIGNAVARMNDRLNSPDGLAITMFPSHGSADTDNALLTVAKVTKVAQEADGSATFEADIADTTNGRDMANLVNPNNPFVRGLSIRGAWMAEPKTVEAADGQDAVTASDLDVFGIDWTGRPGVEGAQITHAEIFESIGVPNAILESVDASIVFDEETPVEPENRLAEAIEGLHAVADLLAEAGDAPGNGKLPYGTNANYADPGYQKDKKKRYPLNTAKRVKSAWAYINVADNASKYSSAQLGRIKSKIKAAAKKFGINVTEEYDQLVAEMESVLEMYASMSISNDAGSISASGYTDDAGKLGPMARRIATAAIIGLNALDPDDDGDIDLTMPDGSTDSSSSSMEAVEPDDDNMESSDCSECGVVLPENALFCPTCGQAVPNAESQPAAEPINNHEEAPVADEVTPTAPEAAAPVEAAPAVAPVAAPAPAAPAGITLTQEQFDALLARAVTPAAPVETVPVEAAPITMTQADIDKLKEDARIAAETDAVERLRAAGALPARVGYATGATAGHLATPVDEAASEPKTLEELSKMDSQALAREATSVFSTNEEWGGLFAAADAKAAKSGLRARGF